MIDTSDEATELPPLREVKVERSLLALDWMIGVDGIVTLMDQDVAVQYLSVRGLVANEDGAAFDQLHIALPTAGLRDLLEEWLTRLPERDDLPG